MTRLKPFTRKTLICFVAFAIAACPIVTKERILAAPGSSQEPAVETAQTQSPIRYRIDARLDEQSMRIRGSESVTYRNTSGDTLQEIVFHTYADANRSKSTQTTMFRRSNEEIREANPQKKPEDYLGGIDIRSATADGQALEYKNSDQALSVQLEQGLKPGESVTVQIGFEVKIPYGIQRLSYYKDIINGAHWFPVASVYDGKGHAWDKTPYSTSFETDYYVSSDFEVHFNVPESYRMLLPGTITTQADPKEAGRKIISAVADNTREFVFFASPNYKIESITRDGLTVEYYYFDNMPDKKKIVDGYIDTAFKAIQFFNKKYGRYPYPEFRIAESYVEGVAIEFARVIQMGQIAGNSDPAHDYVFVHEIAHQWFHALIGNNSEKESFLDEGFADFSKVYYAEKQGDAINGFKSVQIDDISYVDKPIASTNDEAGDDASSVFYDKGRQAIYQLYRMVGEEKFDAFMKEYFKRYVYQNATIKGLLQTIQDTLGNEVRDEMDKAFYQKFTLKPEYQLSEAEKNAYWHEQFQSVYRTSLTQIPDLPEETMSRIVDKALQGEPLTIVMSDEMGGKAKKRQQEIVSRLKESLGFMGIHPEVISERKVLKQKLSKELGSSNLIAIGSAKANGLIQALKPGIMERSKAIGLDFQSAMSRNGASGAYVVKHPYNQNRLLLHLFWNGDMLGDQAVEPFSDQMLKAFSFTSDFYAYYLLDPAGRTLTDRKTANPLAKFFPEE